MSGAEVSKKSHIWRAYSVKHVCSSGWCGKCGIARRLCGGERTRIPQSSILGTNCICAWAFLPENRKRKFEMLLRRVLFWCLHFIFRLLIDEGIWKHINGIIISSQQHNEWLSMKASTRFSIPFAVAHTPHTPKPLALEWQSTNAVQKWYADE